MEWVGRQKGGMAGRSMRSREQIGGVNLVISGGSVVCYNENMSYISHAPYQIRALALSHNTEINKSDNGGYFVIFPILEPYITLQL